MLLCCGLSSRASSDRERIVVIVIEFIFVHLQLMLNEIEGKWQSINLGQLNKITWANYFDLCLKF